MDLKQTLTELGINIGMSIGGFLGSLVLVGRQEGASLRTQLFSILAGTLSANYLTPLAITLLGIELESAQFAMAFLIGFSGLRVVETLSNYFHKKVQAKGNES
jgi:hypothetical protein